MVVIDWQGIGLVRAPTTWPTCSAARCPSRTAAPTNASWWPPTTNGLTAKGVDYSATAVWDDYCYAHAVGGLATTLFAGATLDLSNERGKALITSMAQRHFTAALDHDCGRLMKP